MNQFLPDPRFDQQPAAEPVLPNDPVPRLVAVAQQRFAPGGVPAAAIPAFVRLIADGVRGEIPDDATGTHLQARFDALIKEVSQ